MCKRNGRAHWWSLAHWVANNYEHGFTFEPWAWRAQIREKAISDVYGEKTILLSNSMNHLPLINEPLVNSNFLSRPGYLITGCKQNLRWIWNNTRRMTVDLTLYSIVHIWVTSFEILNDTNRLFRYSHIIHVCVG